MARLDHLHGRFKMFQVRQGKADQIGFLRLQHLQHIRVGTDAEFGRARLRFFQGASGHRAKRYVRPLREKASVLTAPLTRSDEANLYLSGGGAHCRWRRLPVSPPKKNASNARWISSTPKRCVMI